MHRYMYFADTIQSQFEFVQTLVHTKSQQYGIITHGVQSVTRDKNLGTKGSQPDNRQIGIQN